jgi:voltage-gated potassium channel
MAKSPSPALLKIQQLPQYAGFFFQTLSSPILITFAILGLFCLVIGSGIFYSYEVDVNPNVASLGDAFWWGMNTITTVGSGEIVPHTLQGRMAGVFLMLTGLVIFISFSTLLVSTFFAHAEIELTKEHQSELEVVMRELNDIKDEIKSLKNNLKS